VGTVVARVPVQSRNSIVGKPGCGTGSGTGAATGGGAEAGGTGMCSPRTATGGRCDGPTVHPASSVATASRSPARTARADRRPAASCVSRLPGTCPSARSPIPFTSPHPARRAVRPR
jgi:hypothetical protein